MTEFKFNERTYQGVLSTTFNKAIEENPSFNFVPAEHVISSSTDSKLKVFVELKNSRWDSTVEELNYQTKKNYLSEISIYCEKTFQIPSKDFKTYSTQIKNVLKSMYSSASYLAVY